jgi:rhodanese-related sulfurtransferase
MKTNILAVMSASFVAVGAFAGDQIPNRLIDYPGFLSDAKAVGTLRAEHRVPEADFIKMSRTPGTTVMDARSTEKYNLLHVKGAKHLSLPDVTAAELAKIIPTKSARVLIYCNNNFENEKLAFATKAARASLNIYTFNTLYSYGYTNVFELGPLVDIHATKLPLEGEKAATINKHP